MIFKVFYRLQQLTGLIAVVLILFAISCAENIPELTGSIQGVVKDYNTGALLSNCQIALSPGGKTAITGSDGMYEFNDLEQDSYTISFSKAGYEEATQTVKVVAGETASVNVTLKAKSPFAASSSKLDFGDLSTTMELYFFNNSDETTSFTISNVPMWASVSHTSGSVSAGGNMPVTVQVNRDAVDYGTHTQVLSVAYKGKVSGTINVTVQMQKVQLSAPKVGIGVAAENVTQNEFTIEGELLATGGAEVTSYGHCWSLTSNPTIDNYKKDNGATTSIGKFKTTVTELTPGTSYYVRAFATNQYGTTYSQEIVVTTQDVASNKWDGNIAKSFAGGNGTSSNPYIIETGGQLLLMKDYNDKYFELANNIDLDNKNWLPFEFSGTLDGKGCVISNLKISRETDKQGLFSTLRGVVQNLTIKNVNIVAPNNNEIGALAGYIDSYQKNITDCHVILNEHSQISGNKHVGGIAGNIRQGTITACSLNYSGTSTDVIKGGENVGGIAGAVQTDAIGSCQVFANVKGGDNVGGIVGHLGYFSQGGQIEKCNFRGKLSGNNFIGGIVGQCASSKYVKACKADVELTVTNEYGGGIIGGQSSPYQSEISACYSTGTINTNSNKTTIGGVLGSSRQEYGPGWTVIKMCYSTITSSNEHFDGISGCIYDYSNRIASSDKSSYSASTAPTRFTETNKGECKDITTFLKDCYQSEYDKYWNYNNTWTWTGTIGGSQVKVSCPKLSWE